MRCSPAPTRGRGEWGSYAEYLKASTLNVAHLPANITLAQGATLPTAGATAWGTVHDVGALQAGQTVLINGGTSNVGMFAIQLAKAAGCKVAATCSGGNVDFVRRLGADQVIDYRREAVLATTLAWAPDGVDFLVDAIGLGSLPDGTPSIIKPGGALVSIETLMPQGPAFKGAGFNAALAEQRQVRLLNNMMAAMRIPQHLRGIVDAIANGSVKPPPYEILPMEQVADAHRRVAEGHVLGKLLLEIAKPRGRVLWPSPSPSPRRRISPKAIHRQPKQITKRQNHETPIPPPISHHCLANHRHATSQSRRLARRSRQPRP